MACVVGRRLQAQAETGATATKPSTTTSIIPGIIPGASQHKWTWPNPPAPLLHEAGACSLSGGLASCVLDRISAGYRTSDIGYRTSDNGYRISAKARHGVRAPADVRVGLVSVRRRRRGGRPRAARHQPWQHAPVRAGSVGSGLVGTTRAKSSTVADAFPAATLANTAPGTACCRESRTDWHDRECREASRSSMSHHRISGHSESSGSQTAQATHVVRHRSRRTLSASIV